MDERSQGNSPEESVDTPALSERPGPSGTTLYVDRDDAEIGSKGPFFVVYEDSNASDRWGYFCGNCEEFDNAMDSMGRIQCNVCSNVRKPDQWDDAHE